MAQQHEVISVMGGHDPFFTAIQEGSMANPEDMFQCQTTNCGCIYNPDRGDKRKKVPAGTAFKDLPEDWKCPVCGAGPKAFRPLGGPGSTAEEAT